MLVFSRQRVDTVPLTQLQRVGGGGWGGEEEEEEEEGRKKEG